LDEVETGKERSTLALEKRVFEDLVIPVETGPESERSEGGEAGGAEERSRDTAKLSTVRETSEGNDGKEM
jgi:hypothetical protein